MSARAWVEGDKLETWCVETVSSQVGQRLKRSRCEPCWERCLWVFPNEMGANWLNVDVGGISTTENQYLR